MQNKNNEVRLHKYIAECGIASRRKSEQLIADGKVKINGKIAKIGDKINPKKDKITVEGKSIALKEKKYYIMLNKPRGYVSTMSDELGRKCVKDLLKSIDQRLYPIGRLDKDSEGLLLMTNDGEFANKIMHPKNHIPKTYRVTVRSKITEEHMISFNMGMMIDGYKTAPADIFIISSSNERTVAKIVLYEGKNRQIRKMFEVLGIQVARLKRVAVGDIKLGMLQPGHFRELTYQEIKSLKNSTEIKKDYRNY